MLREQRHDRIQPYSSRSALCVLGDTPAADEARFLAERLRIRLAETPDEAPVVLVANQRQGDEDALERALKSPAAHVLMIASRRKAERLRAVMRMRGIGDAQLARLERVQVLDAYCAARNRNDCRDVPISQAVAQACLLVPVPSRRKCAACSRHLVPNRGRRQS